MPKSFHDLNFNQKIFGESFAVYFNTSKALKKSFV